MVKNPPANAGNRDKGLIPGLKRSLVVGSGNPLQYACLENSMDREARRAAIHQDPNSWTRLSTHTNI